MGVQVAGACYETLEQAAQATASAQLGRVVESPGGLYAVDVAGTTASSITYAFSALDGGPTLTSVTVPFTPPPCNLLDTAEAVELGWKVIAALATVWAVKFLARQFRNP